jgi:hypothetical protein
MNAFISYVNLINLGGSPSKHRAQIGPSAGETERKLVPSAGDAERPIKSPAEAGLGLLPEGS